MTNIKATEISLADAVSLTGFTKTTIHKLVVSGLIKKAARGTYLLGDVVSGVMKHLNSQKKSATQSTSLARVQNARAREVELRTARAEGELYHRDDVFAYVDIMVGGLIARLDGFPAQMTRDLELRRKMEAGIDLIRREHAVELKARGAAAHALFLKRTGGGDAPDTDEEE